MSYSTIDIANGANEGDTQYAQGNTWISEDNAANATGTITVMEVMYQAGYGTDATGTKIGTFTGSSTSWTLNDYETGFGTIGRGSKQSFTGLNCSVTSGDLLGHYSTAGYIESNSSGGAGGLYKAGDNFSAGAQTYGHYAGYKLSLYATGYTVPDAPTSVSATDNLTDKVTITWTAGTGETSGHRVYRDGSDVSGVVAHGTATYNDTTAVSGTTYSYTVKAINAAGLSAASSADNGTRVSAASFIQQIIIIQ